MTSHCCAHFFRRWREYSRDNWHSRYVRSRRVQHPGVFASRMNIGSNYTSSGSSAGFGFRPYGAWSQSRGIWSYGASRPFLQRFGNNRSDPRQVRSSVSGSGSAISALWSRPRFMFPTRRVPMQSANSVPRSQYGQSAARASSFAPGMRPSSVYNQPRPVQQPRQFSWAASQ